MHGDALLRLKSNLSLIAAIVSEKRVCDKPPRQTPLERDLITTKFPLRRTPLRDKSLQDKTPQCQKSSGDAVAKPIAHWTSCVQRFLERANRISRVTAAKYISLTVLNLFYSERVAENFTSSPLLDDGNGDNASNFTVQTVFYDFDHWLLS